MRLMIWLLTLCLCFTTSMVLAENQEQKSQAPLFDNLGSYHRPISTHNQLTQRFFDQGMTLYYAFEWGESARSFKEAARLDPHCGICYWGLSLALLNKVNAPTTGHEYADAKKAILKAQSLRAYENPEEQDYINALSLYFKHAGKEKKGTGGFSCHAQSMLGSNHAYILALKKIANKYPNDLDAKVLYAATLFWIQDKNNSKTGDAKIREAQKILKEVLDKDPSNIGANHYYIHFTETTKHPEDALESANRLNTLVPGSEHLVHMPAHIYFLTGRYHQATEANQQATKVFQEYDEACQAQGFKPEVNYLYFHNYDFLRSAASMEGRKQLALKAARHIVEIPYPPEQKELFDQWFMPVPLYVEARFGLWNDILKTPPPKANQSYALGMWHYAQGIALARTGEVQAAEKQSSQLAQIIQKGPKESTLGKDGIRMLKLANNVLMATLADLHGQEKSSLAYLLTAQKIQQSEGYHEPPDWYFPLYEALGDFYLKWHHPKSAKEMYEKDLKQYPENGWGLFGLEKSLEELGDKEEAAKVEQEYKAAWQYADIPAPLSLFP